MVMSKITGAGVRLGVYGERFDGQKRGWRDVEGVVSSCLVKNELGDGNESEYIVVVSQEVFLIGYVQYLSMASWKKASKIRPDEPYLPRLIWSE